MHTPLIVLGLASLLGLSALMLPAAKRLSIPYTVLLAIVGCCLGGLNLWAPELSEPGLLSDIFHTLHEFKITSDEVLFIFLPALVFESALSINTHRLMDDLLPILILAILGLLISTFIIGFGMVLVSNQTLIVCLLLGAILSATDPVAVVALFKELQAPKRLAILVEGESLFNDATAIVLFSLLSGIILEGQNATLASGSLLFLKIFLGGVMVGLAGGWLFCSLFKFLGKFPTVEITLSLCQAYLSFGIAEHYFHVSGVMAVVSGALVLGARGRSIIAPANWHTLKEIWEYIGFWANSLIFILVGLVIPKIIYQFEIRELLLLFTLLVFALLGRGAIIYGLLPVFNRWKLIEDISFPFKTVMFWGGLRGAVSLALALSVIENPAYSTELRHFIGILVTGFVLFTLFVNATTVGKLMRFFHLDELSQEDKIMRGKAMEVSLKNLAEKITTASQDFKVSQELTDELTARLRKQAWKSKMEPYNSNQVSEESWLKTGLMDLTHNERDLYLKLFDEHWINSSTTRIMLNQSEDILDAIRLSGPKGYTATWKNHLAFHWKFHLGRKLQELFKYSGLMSLALSQRLEVLIFQKKVLNEIITNQIPKLAQFLENPITIDLNQILEKRIHATNKALTLLKLQYPEYTRTLERKYLERMALRLETRNFREMHNNSLISTEVYQNLENQIETEEERLNKMPPLDLKLEPEFLLKRVPLFENFPPQKIKGLASLLHTHLAIPGETIIKKGEIGKDMYFISSGSIEVHLEPTPALLGTGDFFGEIALITHQYRTANVTAHGFSNLLVLKQDDFNSFIKENPDLKILLDQTAKNRLNRLNKD